MARADCGVPGGAEELVDVAGAQRRAGGLDPGSDLRVCPVPAYGERDLRKSLECGILAHGLRGRAVKSVVRTFW